MDTHEEIDSEEEKRMVDIMCKFKRLIEKPYESDNIFVEMDILNLKKTYQRAQSELHEAFKLFEIKNPVDESNALTQPINNKIKKHEIRIKFEELCYTCKVTNQEVKKYFDMMKQRVREIEDVINKHFELIKGTIRQDKIDKIERAKKKE